MMKRFDITLVFGDDRIQHLRVYAVDEYDARNAACIAYSESTVIGIIFTPYGE